MIHGIVSNNSIPAIAAMNIRSGGKVALPVAPQALIYSYLENVSGFPAAEGRAGITITRLNVLDALIGQMNRTGKAVFLPEAGIPEDRINAVIEGLSSALSRTMEAAKSMPYRTAPEAGLLFSISI